MSDRNNHLLRYCQQEKITFTRGRSGKKNDVGFVEQNNYLVVRRVVGMPAMIHRRNCAC